MQLALDRSKIGLEDMNYINAYGTATPDNGLSETNAIKKVFGKSTYNVKINSPKSMMGHTIGGASAIETLVCLLAMENHVASTINLL